MSSVLHPVGPEPRERYWVRRLAVLVAAVVAIGIVIALVGNAMSAGSAVQAEPAPPTLPPVSTAPTSTPSASPTPAPSTPAYDPTATPSATAAATPTAGSPSESATSTSSASASDKKASSTTASEDAEKKAAGKKEKKKASGKKKVIEQPVYAPCKGSKLRPTLTGDRTAKAGKKTTLSLSLINGGKKTCTARVSTSNATLTVVSGSDRIWSTKDCPRALPATKRTLLPEHALTWKVTWSGKRSGDGCSTGRPAPKKGYYWAIASFDGADDVRFRIILT